MYIVYLQARRGETETRQVAGTIASERYVSFYVSCELGISLTPVVVVPGIPAEGGGGYGSLSFFLVGSLTLADMSGIGKFVANNGNCLFHVYMI